MVIFNCSFYFLAFYCIHSCAISLFSTYFTGDNATIDGQGSVWWDKFSSHSLNYSRPHVVEFIDSNNIVISNLTFLNPPAWNIHPAYCRLLAKLSGTSCFFFPKAYQMCSF